MEMYYVCTCVLLLSTGGVLITSVDTVDELVAHVGEPAAAPVGDPVADGAQPVAAPVDDPVAVPVLLKASVRSSGYWHYYNGYADYDMSDWMATVPDEQSLALMSIPGTHDTVARLCVCGDACNTQQWTVDDQLRAGIRYVDARLRFHGDGLYLHHGPCYLEMTFGTLLNKLAFFLRYHPSETVLVRVKQEYSSVSDAEFIQRFQRYVQDGRQSLIHQQSAIPTLKEVRDKIVVISNVAGLQGIQWDSLKVQDDFAVWDLPANKDAKAHGVKIHLKAAVEAHRGGQEQIYLNHLSGGVHSLPYRVAGWVNREIYVYLMRNELCPDFQRNAYCYYGIVIMDFPGPVLVNQIIKQNENSKLKGSPIVMLYNQYYSGYLYAASSYVDRTQRNVFMPTNGTLPPQAYWLRYSLGADKYAYYNTHHKEFLYAASGVVDKRRYTYTWTPALLDLDAVWLRSESTDGVVRLRNAYRNNEFLYASSLLHTSFTFTDYTIVANQTERTVWTWTEGTQVIESGWKESKVGVYDGNVASEGPITGLGSDFPAIGQLPAM